MIRSNETQIHSNETQIQFAVFTDRSHGASRPHMITPRPLFNVASNIVIWDVVCIPAPYCYIPCAGCKTRLHTPKAVTYHEQSHYCR